MSHLGNRLRNLPTPTVSDALTQRVLSTALAVLEKAAAAQSVPPTDKWLGILLAAASLLHFVWTVFFLQGLAH